MRMLVKFLTAALILGLVWGQENEINDVTRRLRFRRPKLRPKLVEVDNPDGDLRGAPVELTLEDGGIEIGSGEDLLAGVDPNLPSLLDAALAEEDQDNSLFRPAQESSPFSSPGQSQSNNNAALKALIATAQRDEPSQEVAARPREQLSEAVAARRPLATRTRTRLPPRRRPRPTQAPGREGDEDQAGPRRRPGPRVRDEPVKTLERYSHKNEDGSFTFGYVGADGSFREETRGADCITRGKYGYIDPDGVKREYTYTSGLPCDVGEDSDGLQDLDDGAAEDPIDPNERFRQTQQQQLADADIPAAARPRIPRPQRPAPAQSSAPATDGFSNFRSVPQRTRPVLQRRPPTQRPVQVNPATVAGGGALQNLFNIAQEGPASVAAPAIPARRPIPVARPAPVAAAPVSPPRQTPFDFDAEIQDFTLAKPAITFEQQRPAAPAVGNGAQFQSQLVFDQNTGTFQTQLSQNIPGHGQVNLQNNAAPSGAAEATRSPVVNQPGLPPLPSLPVVQTTSRPAPRPSPVPTRLPSPVPTRLPSPVPTRLPSPVPTRLPSPVPTRLPSPVPTRLPSPVPSSPAPSLATTRAPSPQAIVPAGTIQLKLEPVNLSSPTSLPRLPSPSPESPRAANPIKIEPAPSPSPSPSPSPVTTAQPSPSPIPTRQLASPRPSPTQGSPPPAPGAPQSNTFFVFRPFNQQGRPAPPPLPQTAPFQTRPNPNAFHIPPPGQRPAPEGPRTAQAPVPQGARPPIPQGAVPVPQGFPQGSRFVPQSGRPAPQPTRPVGAPQPSPPQLQFGFQPVQQQTAQQPRPVPQRVPPPVPVQQRPPQQRPPQQRPPQPPQQRPPQPPQQRPPQPPQQRPPQPPQQRPPQPQRPPPQGPPPRGAPGRPAPFTAFASGTPPQLQRPRGQQQLGVPPQLQQPGQQRPPAFSQFDSRFAPRPQAPQQQQAPQLRPAQFQQGFSLFNPTQLRGA